MVEARPASLLHLHRFDLPGENAGARHHRALQPIELLHNDPDFAPAELSWITPGAPEHALAADLLVVHALAGIEIEALIRERRQLGRVTLFEIGDDLSAPRDWGDSRSKVPSVMTVGRQCLHASLADGVQFSSARLRAKYASLHAQATVLDNAVAFPAHVPLRGQGFVFGWAGTRSHQADLAPIAPAITAFCLERPDATFALMGDAALADLFDGVPRGQFRWQPFGSYADYRRFLGTLHVGLVAIGDGEFARGRTDVKAIEMVAEGAAVLIQSAPALDALPAVMPRFDNGAALSALLAPLHEQPERIAALARETRDIVRVQRDMAAIGAQHRDWYRSWIRTRTDPLDISGGGDLALQFLAAEESAHDDALDDALAMLRALLAVNPGYAQARWLAVRLLAKAGRPDEAMELGVPLRSFPVHRHIWANFVGSLVGTADTSGIVSMPIPPKSSATSTDHMAFHQALLDAHPFHPFALAAEEHRLRKAGDIAAAAILRGRRALLADPA